MGAEGPSPSLRGAGDPADVEARDSEGGGGMRDLALGTLEHLGGLADLTLGAARRVSHGAVCQIEELRATTLGIGEVAQDLLIGHDGSQTAFVTLRSVADRVIAEQLVISHSGNWKVRAAPEARDVFWPNAAVPLLQTQVRSLVARMLLTFSLIFWSVPVGLIQVWTSFDADPPNWAQSDIGVLGYTFLRKYMPVLGLIGLQSSLPLALDQLAKRYEGYKVKSQIEMVVLRRNFAFQLATLYVTVFCGTASMTLDSQLQEIADRPAALFELLRERVPQVSGFFLSYVVARVGITVPMLLWLPSLLAWSGGLARRERQPVAISLAVEASNHGQVLVLALTYSVIAPILMPVCLVYFALAFLVYGWLFLYVYTPEFDCLGACWYKLFDGAMTGLFFGSLSLAALASAFEGFRSVEFSALLVLSMLVVLAHFYYHYHFAVPSEFISLEDACELDMKCDEEEVAAALVEDYYVDPILKEQAHEDPNATAGLRKLAVSLRSLSGRALVPGKHTQEATSPKASKLDGSDAAVEREAAAHELGAQEAQKPPPFQLELPDVEAQTLEASAAAEQAMSQVEATVEFGEEVGRLGFEVLWDGAWPAVSNVAPEGEAARRGVAVGDLLREVNGTCTLGKSRSELLPLLKQRPLRLKLSSVPAAAG